MIFKTKNRLFLGFARLLKQLTGKCASLSDGLCLRLLEMDTEASLSRSPLYTLG